MDDAEFALAPGERLTVRLPEAGGAGYLWDVEALDPAVVRVASRFVEPGRGWDGGHAVLALGLVGVGPGETVMEHRRPWLPGSATARCTVRCS